MTTALNADADAISANTTENCLKRTPCTPSTSTSGAAASATAAAAAMCSIPGEPPRRTDVNAQAAIPAESASDARNA